MSSSIRPRTVAGNVPDDNARFARARQALNASAYNVEINTHGSSI